jgi:hypothetical protein
MSVGAEIAFWLQHATVKDDIGCASASIEMEPV